MLWPCLVCLRLWVCIHGLTVAWSLIHLSQWIEAYPLRARWIGVRYAQVQLGLVLLMYVCGHLPLPAAVLCASLGVYGLICMWPATWPSQSRPPIVARAVWGVGVPLAAHASLTSHYGGVQHAWIAHAHGLAQEAPSLPYAQAHEVVALIAGLVWALPVYQFVSETTQTWSLPTRT